MSRQKNGSDEVSALILYGLAGALAIAVPFYLLALFLMSIYALIGSIKNKGSKERQISYNRERQAVIDAKEEIDSLRGVVAQLS